MRSPKTKLALIAALAVVLTLAAAAIAFNLFVGWKIEADAVRDIEYVFDWAPDDTETGRAPNYIILDSSYEIEPEEHYWSTEGETELASWFAKHPTEGVVNHVVFDDWSCYACMVSEDEFLADYELGYEPRFEYYDEQDESGYIVVYIDVTAEQSLVVTVNTAFAIIAVLGVLIAAAAGYRAGRRIEQAQQAQKRFYENMSHELKTPLAAIRGYAEGARGGVVDGNDAMRAIERESGKMANMIDEILGLSRLEAGGVALHRETIDVGDFAQDCLMPFEGAVRAKGLDVQLSLASGTVEADRDLFDHAFSNVLSNAVRHAANIVSIVYDGSAIRVANDGNLPTEDQLAHFFDRFYVGEGGSTGIGLAIAREVAVRHGWRISAAIQGSLLVISIDFGK